MTTKFKKTPYVFNNISYNIDTWYKHLDKNPNRRSIFILNNGVDNKMIVGKIFISLRDDDIIETAPKTDGGLEIFYPGDNRELGCDSTVRINILCDTLNVTCLIEEKDHYISVGLESVD